MATMARDGWTDERLDDLNGKVDRLDSRIEAGFAEMREEIRAGRAEMREELRSGREEFGYLRGDMREIRTEMGALNRTIHQFMASIVTAILLGFFGTIAALISLA